MNEKKCDTVILEDNKVYVIVNEKDYNNSHYILLAEEENANNFCIRKQLIEDDKECFCGLDSDEEFDEVLKIIAE